MAMAMIVFESLMFWEKQSHGEAEPPIPPALWVVGEAEHEPSDAPGYQQLYQGKALPLALGRFVQATISTRGSSRLAGVLT